MTADSDATRGWSPDANPPTLTPQQGLPTSVLADVIPSSSSGTGVGIFRFAGDLGFTLGPLVAGFAAAHLGFEAAFALAAVPAAVAFVAVARGHETLPALLTASEELA